MKERLSGLDALRALLILLGIPFHAALPFADGALGVMQSDQTSGAVGVLVLVLRTFRMPTFFVVAGFFAAMILARRSPEAWLAERFRRLVIPMVFGVVTINLVVSVLVRAFRLETGHGIGAPLSSFYHLWFLLTLFGLCLAVYAVRPWLERATDRLGARLSRLSIPRGEVAFLAFVGLVVLWQFGVETLFQAKAVAALPLVGTVHVTAVYAPWFVLGWGLGRIPGGLAWFGRVSPTALALAAGFLALDAMVAKTPNFEAESFAHLAAWTGAAFYLGRALVTAALRLPFADAPGLRRIVDNSMPIYMLHFPWTVAFALLLAPTHWAGGVQFVVVTLLTVVATVVTTALVAKSTVLWFLLNGRRPEPTRRAAIPAGAAA